MKYALFLLVGVPSLASIATAAPSCVAGTLADYIALGSGGCSVGSINFANFAYTAKASGGAPQIPPDKIQVSPGFVVPDAGALAFSAAWQVGPGQTQDSLIKYTVVPSSTTSTGSLTSQMGAAHPGKVGAIRISEMTNVGNLQVYSACSEVGCRSRTIDTLQFSPSAVGLQVVDHVKLTSTNGTTSLKEFTATFNYCPPCV